jgi:hypothetical protein
MGLLWNSKGTKLMLERLALEFSGDASETATAPNGLAFSPPITRWQPLRDDFLTKDLRTIAMEQHIYGVDDPNSSENTHWTNWLDDLKSTGAHKKLRGQIWTGLDPNAFDEIVFAVIPKSHGYAVTVEDAETSVDDQGKVAQVITVRTPTARAVRQWVRKKRARQAADKAAKKKKG